MKITPPNISFNGTFLINYANTPKSLRENFDQNVKRKITFNDFGGENKVLYVLKDSKDFETANFVKNNHLRFVYYPDMNTQLCFEPDKPEVVQQYIADNKPLAIRNKKALTEYIAEHRTANKAIPDSNKSFPQKLSEKLILNITGKAEKDCRGVTTVKDENGSGFMKLSPWSPNGFRYVYVKPSNNYDEIQRFAVDRDCNVLATFNTASGIQQFHKNFKLAIQTQGRKKD